MKRKQFLKTLVLVILLLAVLHLYRSLSKAELPRLVTETEMDAASSWTENHLTGKNAQLPFSFKYGETESEKLLANLKPQISTKKIDKNRTAYQQVWDDPKTGLQVRNEIMTYTDYPVVEWTVYLKNNGTENTPAISDLKGISITLPTEAGYTPLLHGREGDYEKAKCFGPFIDTLSIGKVAIFAPHGPSGKSTDGPRGWPYHNLQTATDKGYIIVLGWPGQWEDTFKGQAGNIEVKGGQQLLNTYLEPGEEIRTPLNLIMFWQGKDVIDAQNLWRRFYLAHVIPHFDGKPQQPAIEIQCSPAKSSIAYLQKYIDNGIKPDISWQDANWYPSEEGPYGPNGWKDESFPDWLDPKDYDTWLNTGTWEINPRRFPDGFKDFSNFAREQGVQFLVWFEPERVGDPTSWLGKNHPEWLMPNVHGGILNEGNREARMWLTNHIDKFIKDNGLVWYREDMNGGGPCPAWRRNDKEGRAGMTENLYVQGHLAYWDSLKARNPGLHIDACASGGRRNDLETMRRAVPLLRSDFQWNHMDNLLRGNQGHTYGLSAWLPYQGTATYDTTTYASRSFYIPAFGTVGLNDNTLAYIKKVYAEQRAIAPDMLFGDYYPLTPYSIDADHWIAWQFNQPEEGRGVVQAFRRENCNATITLKLRGVEPAASYRFTDFDGGEPFIIKGKVLLEKGLTVTTNETPEAKIYAYTKVD